MRPTSRVADVVAASQEGRTIFRQYGCKQGWTFSPASNNRGFKLTKKRGATMTHWTGNETQKNVRAQLGKRLLTVGAVIALVSILAGARSAPAQVAGSSTLGITKEELKIVTIGWSAKKKILGKAVYNDNKQKIGVIDDL